jgi:hypothetical protein
MPILLEELESRAWTEFPADERGEFGKNRNSVRIDRAHVISRPDRLRIGVAGLILPMTRIEEMAHC